VKSSGARVEFVWGDRLKAIITRGSRWGTIQVRVDTVVVRFCPFCQRQTEKENKTIIKLIIIIIIKIITKLTK
jgi:hypothetical protein